MPPPLAYAVICLSGLAALSLSPTALALSAGPDLSLNAPAEARPRLLVALNAPNAPVAAAVAAPAAVLAADGAAAQPSVGPSASPAADPSGEALAGALPAAGSLASVAAAWPPSADLLGAALPWVPSAAAADTGPATPSRQQRQDRQQALTGMALGALLVGLALRQALRQVLQRRPLARR